MSGTDVRQLRTIMEDFLRDRGLSDQLIDRLNTEKIDATCLQIMTDDQLAGYIPHYGDRLALRSFLDKTNSENTRTTRRQSLFTRLRNRLKRRDDEPEPSSSSKQTKSSPQSQNAVKNCRMVSIGLMHYDFKKKTYLQVRTKLGGGTRHTSISKSATKTDILSEAKNIFFPNGRSAKFGSESDYDFDVMDYQYVTLQSDLTIQEMYSITKLPNLRFYLSLKHRPEDENKEMDKDKTEATGVSEQKSATDSLDRPVEVGRPDDISLDSTDTFDPVDLLAPESPLPDLLSLTSYNSSEVPIAGESPADIGRLIDEIDRHIGKLHNIRLHRGHVFTELKNEFKTQKFDLEKDLFTFQMILPNGEEEPAEDSGGVVRDALVEFWSSFYDQCTVGRQFKIPFIRHDYQEEDWKAIAKVLYLGWREQNYFPIQLSKAFVSCSAYGIDTYGSSTDSLMKEFLLHIPQSEMEVLSSALEGNIDQDDLIEVLGNHECRVLPKPDNLKQLLTEIAHKEIIQQPMFIKECWFHQLSALNLDLRRHSLDSLYDNLIPNNRRVAKILCFPDDMSRPQLSTSDFLKRFVREMDSDLLASFLRFCTGSDILLMDGAGKYLMITVRFTGISGLSRRPVAHTCGRVLEVPESYDSYLEFRSEFTSLLRSDVWVMDFV